MPTRSRHARSDAAANPPAPATRAARVRRFLQKAAEQVARGVLVMAGAWVLSLPTTERLVETWLMAMMVAAACVPFRTAFPLRSASGNASLPEDHEDTLRGRLSRAGARGEFRLHYQPRIDIDTGRIVSAEALLRWQQPDGSLVAPDDFIPEAEETGLIRSIGAWVLEEACRDCRRWQQIGLAGLPVSVNVSAVQFRWGDLESVVEGALLGSGLDPALLEIELTESRALEDSDTGGQIARIAATGVRVAIDDFGKGYSNLARLGELDIQTLKIDRFFLHNIEEDDKGLALLEAIVGLTRRLGLEAVAEGVETPAAAARLAMIGCSRAQGYLWSKPLPPREFEHFALAWEPLGAMDMPKKRAGRPA